MPVQSCKRELQQLPVVYPGSWQRGKGPSQTQTADECALTSWSRYGLKNIPLFITVRCTEVINHLLCYFILVFLLLLLKIRPITTTQTETEMLHQTKSSTFFPQLHQQMSRQHHPTWRAAHGGGGEDETRGCCATEAEREKEPNTKDQLTEDHQKHVLNTMFVRVGRGSATDLYNQHKATKATQTNQVHSQRAAPYLTSLRLLISCFEFFFLSLQNYKVHADGVTVTQRKRLCLTLQFVFQPFPLLLYRHCVTLDGRLDHQTSVNRPFPC